MKNIFLILISVLFFSCKTVGFVEFSTNQQIGINVGGDVDFHNRKNLKDSVQIGDNVKFNKKHIWKMN